LGVIVILFCTCELRGFISNINNKEKINISSLFITIDSVENNLGFSSPNSFLVCLRSYYDLDLSFIIIYIAKSLVFKALALIIISLRLLSLSLRIKVLIIL
jgi:hypothetical protein